MAKIVIPAQKGAQRRVLARAIEVLVNANIIAKGQVLLVYPILRVAERDSHSAVSALRKVGIKAMLK
ncbi:MAG TPA: hypothetical protein VMD75_00145 [Candidatus Binataceae bacterium]|nr:hypothetical protein [Candidatus Binataceae bacterium]